VKRGDKRLSVSNGVVMFSGNTSVEREERDKMGKRFCKRFSLVCQVHTAESSYMQEQTNRASARRQGLR